MNSREAISDTMGEVASSETPSLFSQKLRRLVEGRVKTEIDAGAGLRKGTISLILHRGNTPPPTEAIRIANYLKVSKDWLLDEGNESLDPPANHPAGVDLASLDDEALLRELKNRFTAIAREIEDLLSRAEDYPWEAVSAWLLSRFVPPKPESDFVMAGLQLFKDIEPKAARFMKIAQSAAPAGEHVVDLDGGIPVVISVPALIKRFDDLREQHPGIQAVSYYLHGFDETWYPVGGSDKYGDKPTPDWDDRRAWLLSRLVTHPDLKDDPSYEPIRARLRGMNYIDAEGKPRNYGYSKIGLGDFELPEPNWDTSG